MTAPLRQPLNTALIARRLAPLIREMFADEVKRDRQDAEIMEAAEEVGHAVDRLLQAKFTQLEPNARVNLEKAATRLRRLMSKYGRMP